jgi:hypothetical protein
MAKNPHFGVKIGSWKRDWPGTQVSPNILYVYNRNNGRPMSFFWPLFGGHFWSFARGFPRKWSNFGVKNGSNLGCSSVVHFLGHFLGGRNLDWLKKSDPCAEFLGNSKSGFLSFLDRFHCYSFVFFGRLSGFSGRVVLFALFLWSKVIPCYSFVFFTIFEVKKSWPKCHFFVNFRRWPRNLVKNRPFLGSKMTKKSTWPTEEKITYFGSFLVKNRHFLG